ncbi:MAG: N-acetylornithine carbamoyltransferase [Deltaproteobacteria bacterium]|nr:MAG: N-acetylornithine carbamoyltransferase [Deltaproteobacteria bacterium]
MLYLLDGLDWGTAPFRALVARALELEAGAAPRRAPGKRLGAVFLNPSLRTRTSIEAAAGMLGIQPIVLQPGTDTWALELAEGAVMDGLTVEHVKDAVAVLSGFVDALAVRAFAGLVDPEEDRAEPVLQAFVDYSTVPVINLESARWHPLQGLADAATITRRLGPDPKGEPLVLTWAPHPKALPAAVPNQVLLTAAALGMQITLAHPEGFDLDPQVVARAGAIAADEGGGLTVSHDRACLREARVVVAKSWGGWSGYGRRDDEARRRAELSSWRVEERDLAPDAGLMHCLPVRRNVVATDAALDGPNSWVIETAHRRMWTAAAVLEQMLAEEM